MAEEKKNELEAEYEGEEVTVYTLTDEDGRVVRGISFFVDIEPEGEYKDLDKDGIIYLGDLDAGEYYVELLPIAGYKVTFVDEHGYVLEEKEYNYGDTPAYDAPDGFDITYDPTVETVSDDATYEVSLTKVYEIVKQDDSMGKGNRRAAFLLDAGSSTDDLPEWAERLSCSEILNGTRREL